ncbi:MAG TPA: PxKF domain-containing protein, partial [Acidimicrobiales bacterium]|nr:PxKF domain-containing protein [Acidimicrobiales bacterium]
NKLSQSPNQDGVTDPANTTPTFTFDSGKKLYKYNWKTDKNMSGYWWRVGVMLDDGTIHTVIIGLK